VEDVRFATFLVLSILNWATFYPYGEASLSTEQLVAATVHFIWRALQSSNDDHEWVN
jgi:hypothetical protein